jgi:hypothetical protein
MSTIDPGTIHPGFQHGLDPLSIVSSTIGERHHDPHTTLGSRGPKQASGILVEQRSARGRVQRRYRPRRSASRQFAQAGQDRIQRS